ncbi:SRPBCC family protein [Sphingomonas sp. KRR8]|uniref:SRPBCC family protein n=1 Tax=Sphingomonas sp. KRR8 TaxID=2942996 RepID=UPI0020228464|nr:SRPBCC family protein [Sphingomonas sp. KRR8]URD61278.1 SRPBCC family protein [Sphingomonas sp. KRR8]
MAETLIAPRISRMGPDTIRLERLLDASIETVWRYLTEADLRRTWFMGGTDASDQGEFDLVIDHDNLSDEVVPYPESYAASKGKTMREKVLRFEPPNLLETTFGGGEQGIVTYALQARGGQTLLTLTHRGITSPTGPQNFGSGWTSHLEMLAHRVAGTGVANFWTLHAQSQEEVRAALAS